MANAIKFELDRSMINRIAVDAAQKAVDKYALAAQLQVKRNIVNSGRVDTGKMRDTIRVASPSPLKREIYSAVSYYHFQEFGTKAHGPRTASVMAFRPKGSGTYVFAKWVRGVKPGNFMKKALEETRRQIASDFS